MTIDAFELIAPRLRSAAFNKDAVVNHKETILKFLWQ